MMKRALQVAGVLIVILLLAALSLPFLVNANEFRPRIEAAATAAVGRKVSLGDLSFSIFSGSLTAQDLSIADDPRFSSEPFFRAKSLALGVNVRQLLRSRTVAITDLTISDAEIALIENAAGDWNFSSAVSKGSTRGVVRPVSTAGEQPVGGSAAPLDFLVRLVSINNSRVSVTQPGGNQKPLVLEKVDIALKEFSPEGGFPFSLTAKLDPAGDIKLDGNVGKIPADSFLTPVQINMKITDVDLATVGMIASEGVSGVISIDGSANLEANMLDTKGRAPYRAREAGAAGSSLKAAFGVRLRGTAQSADSRRCPEPGRGSSRQGARFHHRQLRGDGRRDEGHSFTCRVPQFLSIRRSRSFRRSEFNSPPVHRSKAEPSP